MNLDNLDNDIDELFRKLSKKKEMIDKMEEGKEKEREERVYLERINYLKKNFPSAYNSCSYALTKNLNTYREPDHKVVQGERQTVFIGLNLRSSHICKDTYLHNFPLGSGIYILDNYYMKKFKCQIEGCGEEFCFDRYFTFFQCYFSVNNEPEKSTGPFDNVVKFSILPGEKKKIGVRKFEKFNIIINGVKIFDFYFPKGSTVREFKKYIEEKSGNIFILKEVHFFNLYQKKKLENFDTLECVTGEEFDIELVKDDKSFNNFELKEKFKIIMSLK